MADKLPPSSVQRSKRSATSAMNAQGPAPKRQQSARPSIVPKETADLREFIKNNPEDEAKARRFDTLSRGSLKEKYISFGQGAYNVIKHRTSMQEPDQLIEAGPRDPNTAKSKRAKYKCPVCDDFKFDIKRHLETHNKHPALMVYCPSCLQAMPRDDSCTLPEHFINEHPDQIFGNDLNAMQQQQRIVQFGETNDANVLGRLNACVLHHFIAKDQLAQGYTGQRMSQEDINNMSKAEAITHLCNIRPAPAAQPAKQPKSS